MGMHERPSGSYCLCHDGAKISASLRHDHLDGLSSYPHEIDRRSKAERMEARLSTCHTASLEVIDLNGCSIGTNGQTTLTCAHADLHRIGGKRVDGIDRLAHIDSIGSL